MTNIIDHNRLIRAVRSTPNRGATHVFLGDPRSDGSDKTTVEPGNGYSPGVGACGVSVWIEREGRFYTPDLVDANSLSWAFANDDGFPPIIESRYDAGFGVKLTHKLTHVGADGTNGADFNIVELRSDDTVRLSLYVVVRDVGPAGGKIDRLDWDGAENRLTVNGGVRLTLERAPVDAHIAPATETFDSPVAALGYAVSLLPGESFALSFKTEHGCGSFTFHDALLPEYPHSHLSVADGFETSRHTWKEALPARVFCPAPRLALAWERSSYHLMAAMETGLPRISAVNYPGFWMRDCVYVLRALDLIGRHDLARTGCEYMAPMVFIGGFGAESDAPGEAIWALVKHAQATRDDDFLRDVFPDIRKRIAWLERMITAIAPIRLASPDRLPRYINTPDVNVVCLRAADGLIRGRMDFHMPDFFINAWAFAGWSCAAQAARQLGEDALADRWERQAVALDTAIARHLLPKYGNDRDPIIVPYPSGALLGHRAAVKERFESWYRSHRLTPGKERKAEMEWSYFEAGQINNAFLLGLGELAWINLSGMLDDRIVVGKADTPWDVSAFIEGSPSGNEHMPFRNDFGLRGWLRPETALAGNMPHNWTSAQMILLIRNMFVTDEPVSSEDDVNELVLGRGVPVSWLIPGARWGVEKMPTRFGPVTYIATVQPDRTVKIDYRGPVKYRAAFG
jgi:hypothetical protein